MALTLCPGCRQNTDRDAGFCSLCGYDFACDLDEAYNHSVNMWLRITAGLSAVIVLVSARAMGRRLGLADYREMLLLIGIPAAIFWGLMKLFLGGSRRRLWTTALIPSFLIVAGVYACRAGLAPEASLSWRHMLLGTPSEGQPTIALLPPTTTAPAPGGGGQGASTAPAAKAPGTFASLISAGGDCFAFLRKQPELIVTELNSAGVAKMLLPTTLEDRDKLDASRARIRRLQERLSVYDARIRKSTADLSAQIGASGAPNKVRARALRALNRCGGDLIRGVQELVAVHRRSLGATDDLLAFLRSHLDRFMIVNGRPVFARADDTRRYDELRRQVDDLADESAKLLRQVRQRGEQAVRDLDSAADAQPPARPAAPAQASGRW